MPELPEVETIRRQLAPHVQGRTIVGVELLDPRLTRPVAPAEVAAELAGARIERLERAGKYLIWALSGDRHLLLHLRMTGMLLFDPPFEPSHTRARLTLDTGQRVLYADARRFGTAVLLRGARERERYLAQRLGAEPFTSAFTTAYLRARARGRTAPIKAFLLDQRHVAGVGNIYADEALFRARIHPLRPAGKLKPAEWERLRAALEEALSAGIDAKGASIDDFRHIDGAQGSFQDRFLIHLRAGEACVRCGGPVRKLAVGGRGTYVCERCQPRPRPKPHRRQPLRPKLPRS
jgi:formamidopyrimidine-DNA glycosylase